ncbi:MAG: hypothetical protein KDC92_14785, partial [Bacteroidetes bacterium]|nr:hypothetical protein [Bacteroidota bacterium]
IKSHFINWIGALFYLQIVLRYFLPENKLLAKVQNPKFQLAILAPLGLIIILVVYHFILDLSASHYVSRNSEVTANVFLSIVTQDIPYHRYGLLHLNHIFDWIVNLIGWGAIPAISVLALFKNKMGFEFRMVLLPILAYSLLFFFFNPILGMARDWDLFSIAAPFVIAIPIFQLSRAEETTNFISSANKAILIMALLGICRLTVEAVPSLQAKRLLNVGEHLHKTYYAGSVVPLTWGMRAYSDFDDEWFTNKVLQIEESSTIGNDTMMAHFLTQTGLEMIDRKGNSLNAANYFVKALNYAPGYEVATRNAAMQFMYIGDYSTGLFYAQELLKANERLDYLQIAANCAIELKNNALAIDYCNRILAIEPQNKTAQAVLGQLNR